MFVRKLSLYLLLPSALRSCLAYSTPWQCRPGSVDLNELYPELVRDHNDSSIIGEGTDGKIFISNSTLTTATKRFFPEHTTSEQIHHEYWIGHAFDHLNIAKTYSLNRIQDQDDDDEGLCWEMQMEYIPFSLLDLLDIDAWKERKWDMEEALCLFTQLLSAVAYMHDQGIAHRDLKVENVLVARDGTVKLIDFGSAARSRDMLTGKHVWSRENWVGTPITMAPETHGETFFDMEKADVWSLGVVLLRLWAGRYLWEPDAVLGGLEENEDFERFLTQRANGKSCYEDKDDDGGLCMIPWEVREVVEGMLEVDARRRWSMERVMGSLPLDSLWCMLTQREKYS